MALRATRWRNKSQGTLPKPACTLKVCTAHMFQLPTFQRNTVQSLTQWTRSSSQLWLSLPLSLSLVGSTYSKALFTFFAYRVLTRKEWLRQTSNGAECSEPTLPFVPFSVSSLVLGISHWLRHFWSFALYLLLIFSFLILHRNHHPWMCRLSAVL